MRVCVITDNVFLYRHFLEIVRSDVYRGDRFDFFCSAGNRAFSEACGSDAVKPVHLKGENGDFFGRYDLFISLHCRQMFPERLVKEHRCINIHPGFNPYNRGWYPQVFSILNGLPAGATIHEMDCELDHGPVIFQEQVVIEEADTSKDVYKKIQELELRMLRDHLPALLRGDYRLRHTEEGNRNGKEDFAALCRLDLDQRGTFGEFMRMLSAVTFEGYDNAFFYDQDGGKIYVEIRLRKEKTVRGGVLRDRAAVLSAREERCAA